MIQINETTIDKTLLTVNLFDGFWDRWVVHGVQKEDLSFVRQSYITKELWIQKWGRLANDQFLMAKGLDKEGLIKEAEIAYRTSALYYQLIQWIIPEKCQEKLNWFYKSLEVVEHADIISDIETKNIELLIANDRYFGRIRVPSDPRGIIIMVNPLDSTKEELFTYEMDFVENGFITVSFDGPGQGQTFAVHGLKGTKKRWESYVNGLIDYAYGHFTSLPIYLFGTSSGAAWTIYGSCNPKVSKGVAVSPAFRTDKIKLPDYFLERNSYVLEEEAIVPSYNKLTLNKPILLVHGKKDVMVRDEDIYALYELLPKGKSYLEYEDEGHCCNYKLAEIRQKAMEWFEGNWGRNDEL